MIPKQQRKNVFLWALYDFANTPLTSAIGGMFLAQWIVLDNHLDEIWYGAIFAASTIALLFTSPLWGAWSDRIGKRMPFLRWITFVMIILGFLMGCIATSSIPSYTRIIGVLILFFFLQYFYQISLIFYNALLEQISQPETRGKISGIGQAFGEISWLFGNILLLPFANQIITVFGEAGRGQVFFPATLALVIFGLPMVFWFTESQKSKQIPHLTTSSIVHDTIAGFVSLYKKHRNIGIFLVAFMLVSDALLTANLYFAIYLDQIFRITDSQKVVVVALLEIVSTASALVISKVSDRVGIKKILIIACVDLTIIYAMLSGIRSLSLLYVLSILIGFGYGGFYTTSRALLVKLSPKENLGAYFGYFSTFQKFASIIGPLIWGLVILWCKDMGEMKYRIGILTLSVIMLIGTIIMYRVKETQSR